MKKIKVRRLRLEDYVAVTQIQLKCFPNMKPWSQEQFNSLLKHFKEGQIGVELDGKLVASSSRLILNFNNYDETQAWTDLTDNGMITNHDPDGETLCNPQAN